MTNLRKRITVTVSDGMFETIDGISKLRGCSRGRVAAELLSEVEIPLKNSLALMQAASEAPQAVRKAFAEQILNAEKEILTSLDSAHLQMYELSGRGSTPHHCPAYSGLISSSSIYCLHSYH